MTEKSCIYVVATPIGNISDISERAKTILSTADVVAAEDTRQTKKLFNLLEIPSPHFVSYHDHNESGRSDELIKMLQEKNTSLALVSDAGTPCVSDPGYRLISKAQQAGIKVVPIPGPSAVIALISSSGLPSDRFMFVGFLPNKEKAALEEMKRWVELGVSVVFYESPARIAKTIGLLADIAPNSKVSIGRELTKMYEEVVTLPVQQSLEFVKNHQSLKGEMAVMVSFPATSKSEQKPSQQIMESMRKEVEVAFAEGYSHKDLCKQYAECGLNKKELFTFLLKVKSELG